MGKPIEKPMLFSGPLVRAIKAGEKTVTRRLVGAHEPVRLPGERGYWHWVARGKYQSGLTPTGYCPHQPGSRIWVRETFASAKKHIVAYHADGEAGAWMGDGEGGRVWIHHGWIQGCADKSNFGEWHGVERYGGRWRPSIHMPRWASRFDLDVLDVRLERLHDITEEDARAEGTHYFAADPRNLDDGNRAWFATVWDTLYRNSPGSWGSNPWVWRIAFSRAPRQVFG